MRYFIAVVAVCLFAGSVVFGQTAGSIVSVTASYTAHPTNIVIVVNAASNATITLAPASVAGHEVTVVQTGTAPNTVTIVSPGTLVDPNGLCYMGGIGCNGGEAVHLISNGSGTWYVLDGNNNNCTNNSASAPAGAQTKVQKGTVDGQTLYWDNTAKLWKVSSRLLQPTGATTIRYVDGNQAANKILTSDASGNATWQSSGSSSTTSFSLQGWQNITFGLSGTHYFMPTDRDFLGALNTESPAHFKVPFTCTIRSFWVRVENGPGTAPTNHTYTFKLRRNDANPGDQLQVSFVSLDDLSPWVAGATGTMAITSGDDLDIQFTDANSPTNLHIFEWGIEATIP